MEKLSNLRDWRLLIYNNVFLLLKNIVTRLLKLIC